MPDSIKFTELPSGTLGANSIFATAEEAGGGSFASTKVNAANVGNYLVGALQYAGINTEDKTVEGALNELLVYALNIAEEYDSTATYDIGDFVIHSGVLYKCTTAISIPEAWTPAHWTSTLVVDNFGSGGASVTLGTTVPLDASGEDGDLYVQYEALTYKVVEYFVKINGSWRKAPYSKVVALTQAEYDLITPDPTTLYIITDAQSSYQTKQDANLQTTADTIVGAINELKSDITPSAVAFSSNTRLTTNSIQFIKFGKFILMIGVFRGTVLTADETIWVLNNVNVSSLAYDRFIPITGNVGSNYTGYLKFENSGTSIRIYSEVALDNPSLLFVNAIIPIS